MVPEQLTKSLLTLGVVVSVALASALVFAGHETTVTSYTGCLNLGGGTIASVAPGDVPRTPCSSSQVQVHLSGGDITSVSAGPGLQGGSTNGAAQLSLQPAYRLPQTCPAGGVPKWNGATWECGTDADTDTVAFGGFSQVTRNGAEGVPNNMATIGRLLLPAGKYAIFAKVDIHFIELHSDLDTALCQLTAGSDFDWGTLTTIEGGDVTSGVISLMLLHEFDGEGSADMGCFDDGDDTNGFDNSDASWSNLRITAIRLGDFSNVDLVP